MSLRSILARVLSAAALATAVGCQDDTASTCYPPSLWEDYDIHDPRRGVCRWLGDSGNELPERDYGDDVHLSMINVAVGVETLDDCNGCPAEEIDALLMEAIEERCDQPILEFMRGCYDRRINVHDEARCSYIALYWSRCPPPGEGD